MPKNNEYFRISTREDYVNQQFHKNNPVFFVDETHSSSCHEKLVFSPGETVASPRVVSPQLEHHACPLESGHAARHFDDFIQRPAAKKALSLEQSRHVNTPCQASNVFQSHAYEETALQGRPFEAYEHSDKGKTGFMKQEEADMTTGYLIEIGLNSDRLEHTGRKGKDSLWLLFSL